ncbi:MAG TPA: hypothetical protein RMH85_23975 [Polyangiaceae bacterium LLY-WYZ-15_(1-7)]|nr:hypothetical protein [Polyangiaceae bacterium LLY-WYZ-15_(1-7)]HJL11556.1 hypothetical protein [Polyangiaceae bacterium LLY-WYZ-15_(1-7)]HJL22032.1 hypothetical protein [Polyangiaceae bacterium LLY-WYZ-15_(1-7)]HJL35776.1 hypothetical protein [Polyangiaceae bacterium LLY-WYZ-15_(1-7)]HJL48047.1 hypothetical protein [Polyangiaceae bacterium LLY-WYZ-15_(1-7)]
MRRLLIALSMLGCAASQEPLAEGIYWVEFELAEDTCRPEWAPMGEQQVAVPTPDGELPVLFPSPEGLWGYLSVPLEEGTARPEDDLFRTITDTLSNVHGEGLTFERHFVRHMRNPRWEGPEVMPCEWRIVMHYRLAEPCPRECVEQVGYTDEGLYRFGCACP